MGILKSFLSLLFFFILTTLLFSKPTFAQAVDFEVNNEYKSGINFTFFVPKDKATLGVPFKVGTKGSYKDFQFMLQQGQYVGRGFGYPVSTPYFDPVTLYPTQGYFDHLKLAILPTKVPSSGNYPQSPEYPYWQDYGHTAGSIAIFSKPTLLEPEFIKDSTRFKWLQFNSPTGVTLDTDTWYWLIMYSDNNPVGTQEWEYTGMKFSVGYSKGVEATNNFGVVKGWHDQIKWHYINNGDYIGFRIGKSSPLPVDKTPVIIIPGIGGSEFRAAQDFQSTIRECGDSGASPYYYLKDEVIWVNELKAADIACDDYFDVLKLKIDGVTPDYPEVVLSGDIYSGTYSKLIKFLVDNGYEQNKTLFVFPYDWRKDVALTSSQLQNLITSIKNQTGAAKVDIIAHSMGGLVARNYIKDADKASNVRKLITLGTPYLGSVEFLKAILYGKRIGPDEIGKMLAVQSSETKDIFQNMTGGFNLIPNKKYYQFYDGTNSRYPKPFNDKRDIDSNNITGALNYDQLKELLTNKSYNTSLFTSSESLHQSIGDFNQTHGIAITQIVGSGIRTAGELIEGYWVDFGGIKINRFDENTVNGDESVPLFSASLNDSERGISLFNNGEIAYIKHKHGDLPNSNLAQELIKNTLEGNNSLPEGIQTTPFALNGQQVSVHSPIDIHAYDSLGNHTGPLPNGEFETNIPESSYDTLEDSKYIWLPKGEFTVEFEATDNGHFDFKIREYVDDINTETTTYQEVPIQKETQGEIFLNSDSTEPPVLELDKEGNGSLETQVVASSVLNSEENQDQTPPTTTTHLAGTQGNNSWYKSDVLVTLEAKDENSGVLKTEYTLDNGTTTQLYSGPFYVSKEIINTLFAKSTDQAGNQESPLSQQIKIDKTNPVVKISASPTTLWPPLLQKVKVKVSGDATDSGSGVLGKVFEVVDEYDKVEPKFTDFGQTISLESWRRILDWDGRIYTIKVKVTDLAGHTTEAQTEVRVPYFRK